MPDWYRRNGRCFPVRNSPGYEVAFEGLTDKDKDYLRKQYEGEQNGYTHTADRDGRARRAAEAKQRRENGATIKRPALSPLAQEHRFDRRHKSRVY